MKIFVGGSASEDIPGKYRLDCNMLLDELFRNNNDLVFGACNSGIMSDAYLSALGHNRNIVGIEFHSGSFKIATKAKCPIVVCSLQNSFKVTKRFPFKHTNVYVDIIEVLNYSDYQDKTTQELSDYTHNLIKENLENLPKY